MTKVAETPTARKLITELYGDSAAPASPADDVRSAWIAAVHEIAQRAKDALPDSHGRVDSAVKLTLAGDYARQDDGSLLVASQANGTLKYQVTAALCTCPDYHRAPMQQCKHRLTFGLVTRATALCKARMQAQDAPPLADPPPPPAPAPAAPEASSAPLPEARASANLKLHLFNHDVMLTLRDHDEMVLLQRVQALLAHVPTPENTPAAPPLPQCPVHHVVMTQSTKKPGAYYCTRKDDTGRYCKQEVIYR